MKNELALNFIYVMHYNGLIVILTFFQLSTWYMNLIINF
jgi:hypothetical protein